MGGHGGEEGLGVEGVEGVVDEGKEQGVVVGEIGVDGGKGDGWLGRNGGDVGCMEVGWGVDVDEEG